MNTCINVYVLIQHWNLCSNNRHSNKFNILLTLCMVLKGIESITMSYRTALTYLHSITSGPLYCVSSLKRRWCRNAFEKRQTEKLRKTGIMKVYDFLKKGYRTIRKYYNKYLDVWRSPKNNYSSLSLTTAPVVVTITVANTDRQGKYACHWLVHRPGNGVLFAYGKEVTYI